MLLQWFVLKTPVELALNQVRPSSYPMIQIIQGLYTSHVQYLARALVVDMAPHHNVHHAPQLYFFSSYFVNLPQDATVSSTGLTHPLI
jgi:hypothetical protein